MAALDSTSARRRFVFGEFELLPERRLLRRNGQEVSLSAKAFNALVFLVEHAGEVVTKDQLMSALWPDTTVSEGNLTQQILTLRKALGRSWVHTIPKSGYQFVGEIQLLTDDSPTPSNDVSDIVPGSSWKLWYRRWSWRVLSGLAILALVSYGLVRLTSNASRTQPSGPLVSRYIRMGPHTIEGFPPEEGFVADAINQTIRYRLEAATRSWPESVFQAWKPMTRSGQIHKKNGSITADVQLYDHQAKLIWSDQYSQIYPGGEPLIGDVIGEHLARLLEQGQRRTSPGSRGFDAVGDFSLRTSPALPWKYGMARDWTGIGFRHFAYTMAGHCAGVEDEDCWGGEAVPDHGVIGRSRKKGLNEFETISQPPDALWMTTGSQFTVLRWVAPADGRYALHGSIQVADTIGRPCRVKLVHNTFDVLLERRNFAKFGSTLPIDLPDLPLTQGAALDLIFGPEIGVDYLSLNVRLRIQPRL
jgi:DNA-binding winged helix-turn-helix (wHTH) protein